jgi:hypothetical protein
MESKLTSVKVIPNLYKRFRTLSLEQDFTLQKLVNRSMDLFVQDDEFQRTILEYVNLKQSGSKY